MKKFLLSLGVIVAFAAYAIYQRMSSSTLQVTQSPETVLPSTVLPSTSIVPTLTATATSTPTPTATRTGLYKNGSYVGSVADAYYGNVQVKAVISGGKITDVQFLQYPNDRSYSIEVNTQAMPYLKTEAIQAQNANVDIVSGATQTSLAFRQSLADALAKAK